MGSYQIWPCHVTQAKNLSFPYLKSYCSLNFGKSHQISWFCCIPNGSYKKDNLKKGRICHPPPPPQCRIGLSTPLNVIHFGLGLDLALYRKFRSFQIISHFPDLKTRFNLFRCFALSRLFRSFQTVSHFSKIPQFRKDFANSS